MRSLVYGTLSNVSQPSPTLRTAALAAATAGVGAFVGYLLGSWTKKVSSSSPAPSPGTVWSAVPLASPLQPNLVYRLSDVAQASELQTPPTVAAAQASLGAGVQVSGVWVGAAPAGWVPADTGAANRVYVEFSVTRPATLPTQGFTSGARLFVSQGAVA